MQIKDGRTQYGDEAAGLSQRKAEAGAAIASLVSKNLLHETTGQGGKEAILGRGHRRARLQQSRLALDIGNGVPQRGQALLVAGGLHGATMK